MDTDSAQSISDSTAGVQIRHYRNHVSGPHQRQSQNGYRPLRSVETPVADRPLDATAREPPRSTSHRCRVSNTRFGVTHGGISTYPCKQSCHHVVYPADSRLMLWSALRPGVATSMILDVKDLLCALSGHQVRNSRYRAWRLSLEAAGLVSLTTNCNEYA